MYYTYYKVEAGGREGEALAPASPPPFPTPLLSGCANKCVCYMCHNSINRIMSELLMQLLTRYPCDVSTLQLPLLAPTQPAVVTFCLVYVVVPQ